MKPTSKPTKRASRTPLVPCDCCKGKGLVPLSRDLLRTYNQLETETPLMVADLVESGITPNAINNRLVILEKLGLARRRGKCGRWILWLKATPKDQPPQS